MANEIAKAARICAQCGSCASVCPFTNIENFHVRRLVKKLQLGLVDSKLLSTYPWLCSQCTLCHEFCSEDVDLPNVILELRRESIRRGLAPKGVYSIIESILKQGNPYQLPPDRRGRWGGEHPLKGRLAYWVGCTSSLRVKDIAKATINTLMKSGIEFSILDPTLCCGEPLIKLGAINEARKMAEKLLAVIEERGVETIVASCAGCYATFKYDYPNMLGIKLPVEVLHTSQLLSKLTLDYVNTSEVKLAYHDPCNLRRLGVLDEPRKVLRSIKGVELIEPLLSRDKSRCCGGGSAIPAINYEASMSVAYRRLSEDILPLGVNAIASCCPMCYIIFKAVTLRYKMPINVLDLSEIIYMKSKS